MTRDLPPLPPPCQATRTRLTRTRLFGAAGPWIPAGIAVAVGLAAACSASSEQPLPAATQILEVLLEEPDGQHLASPMMLSLTPRGEFLVTDRFHQRVHLYSRDGALRRVLGRQGPGPGEFQMIGAAVLMGDSILAVLDDSRRSITLLRFPDGAYLREVPLEGGGTSIAKAYGDTLTVGLLVAARESGLAEIVLGDTIVRYYGMVPRARLTVPALSGIHTLVAHARGDRGLVVGYSGVDSTYELTATGQVVSATHLPARRRQHLRQDPAEVFGRQAPFPELYAATAFLFDITRLSDGGLAILHFDQSIDDRIISSTPFLTLLPDSVGPTCVDEPLGVVSEARLVPAFRGDTLFFVTQRIENQVVRASIVGFAIDRSRCPDPQGRYE